MKMKKLMAVMTACVMLMGLAACSSDGDAGKAPEVIATGAQATSAEVGGNEGGAGNASSDAGSYSTYSFVYNGYAGAPELPADAVIEGYGSGYSYFESPSCAFQGMDKVYTYSSFIVRTYPMNEVDYVLSIELIDDTVSTPEGIYIGCSEDQVRAAYGEPSVESAGGLEYTMGSCTMAFVIHDGNVSAISYNRVSE